ncbi:MAG: 50S ribosomal protein L17 [Parcubacteria group bacterium GW2011_GWA2_51_12]|nr:MAG: 50S ribosomal protein L17 [Parcubacteria group bacterium GW2011_GWA2_51_12]
MRHRKKRHLRGSPDRQRKELRALATSLILYERIETTQARARLARVAVEKMITRGKKSGLHAIRLLRRDLSLNATKKVVEVLSPRYSARPGGYTRILRRGEFRDGTTKVILELVK